MKNLNDYITEKRTEVLYGEAFFYGNIETLEDTLVGILDDLHYHLNKDFNDKISPAELCDYMQRAIERYKVRK